MGRQFMLGNPSIAVDVRQSSRARRLSLRVSRLDGKVSLTMPSFASDKQAMAFLEEREDWLRKHMEDVQPALEPKIGGTVLFRGQDVPIVGADLKRATFRDDAILVPQDGQSTGTKIRAFMKLAARDALAMASDDYAEAIGKRYTRLSLRDTRSRWGSCSHQGVLMYSWRLIMAPPAVLDYVAAHEVSHLAEMNHSAAFWAVVEGLMPDYPEHRAWLRKHGAGLHRVSFDD